MNHAIVVGASSGIGAAVGAELRRQGWAVSGLARRLPPPESADRGFTCDVTDREALESALSGAASALGEPDALVWCVSRAVMGRTLDVPRDEARAAFEAGFWAMDAAVRVVLPGMCARRRGTILAVLSLAALRAIPHEAYYAAAKAAASRWLECLAHEAKPRGVRVKCVYPGYVDTGFLERGGWWGMKAHARVRGSGVTPEHVAGAVAAMLRDKRPSAVLGWRENAIVLADRLAPGLYDRILRRRTQGEG